MQRFSDLCADSSPGRFTKMQLLTQSRLGRGLRSCISKELLSGSDAAWTQQGLVGPQVTVIGSAVGMWPSLGQ